MSGPIRVKCICAKHRSTSLEFEIVNGVTIGDDTATLLIVTPCEECLTDSYNGGFDSAHYAADEGRY